MKPQRTLIMVAAMLLAGPGRTLQAAEPPAIGAQWQASPLPAASASIAGNAEQDRAAPGAAQTLAQLSDFALRHNPATRSAWAAALADTKGIDAASALQKPFVGASVPVGIASDGGAGVPAGAAAPPGLARTIAPSLALTWVLFDFGARASGVEAARWQAAATQLTYNRTLQTVVNNVEQAYYGLLGARRLETALQSGVTAAQASLDVVLARRRAGLATAGETAQAEAALAEARLKTLQAQAQSRSAAGSLAAAVGAPVDTRLSLATDTSDDDDATNGDLAPVDALLATARLARADLHALDAQVLQGKALVAAIRAQGMPSVALSAQVERQWSSDGDRRDSRRIGLTLSIPLFDGGLVRAQTQAARARVQQLDAQRDQQRQAVDLEVWQAYQDAASAGAVVGSAQALLRSAAVAEDAARERYKAGVGSLLELLVAQSTAAQARVTLVQARFGAQLALSRLAYATGLYAGAAASGAAMTASTLASAGHGRVAAVPDNFAGNHDQ